MAYTDEQYAKDLREMAQADRENAGRAADRGNRREASRLTADAAWNAQELKRVNRQRSRS